MDDGAGIEEWRAIAIAAYSRYEAQGGTYAVPRKEPIQLTILLYLIHNRGAALPEKRTAMYDVYMDMVFSPESEKSDIVRDNPETYL